MITPDDRAVSGAMQTVWMLERQTIQGFGIASRTGSTLERAQVSDEADSCMTMIGFRAAFRFKGDHESIRFFSNPFNFNPYLTLPGGNMNKRQRAHLRPYSLQLLTSGNGRFPELERRCRWLYLWSRLRVLAHDYGFFFGDDDEALANTPQLCTRFPQARLG